MTHFHIEPQALNRALLEFGTQAHVQIMFASNSIMLRAQTKELLGDFTGQQVLAALLKGSNLRFVEHGNTVEIIPDVSGKMTDTANRSANSDPPDIKGSADGKNAGDNTQTATQPSSPNSTDRRAALREVTVTGTRIRGQPPVGVSIQTISEAQIADSGYTTLPELLQSLPDNFRGGAAGASADALFSNGANSGNNYAFGSGINLRGLGNDATLVLIDSHRIAPSGGGYFTDISAIPLSAIDHIDVLTDGSSAIYGTDAVAGVVNIALKRQGQGFQTGARYGYADGFSQYDGNAQYGADWSSGGVTLNAAYSGEGALDVRDRSFTSSITSPTSILPMYHNVWLSAAGQQLLGPDLKIYGDVEYSESRRLSTQSEALPGGQQLVHVPRVSGALGARYRISSAWTLDASLSYGDGVERDLTNEFVAGGAPQLLTAVREVSRLMQPGLDAQGPILSLPGGPVQLDVGATYLTQSFSHLDYSPQSVTTYGTRRHVASGYGEVRIPLVGLANSLPIVKALTFSGAVRSDHYSDFGNTTNYKVGVSWYPATSLQIRGAYSTSFRAPAVGYELLDSQNGTIALVLRPLLNPERTAEIPVLILRGGQPHLGPETANNLTVGFDFIPSTIQGLKLSMDYYRIRYIGQLAMPPSSPTALSNPAFAPTITQYPSSAPVESIVNSAVAAGIPYFNFTGGLFGNDPLSSTVYVYDLRLANLSRTDTSGVDARGSYSFLIGENRLRTSLDATYITAFNTQLTSAAPDVAEVNLVGYPTKLRMSAQVSWGRGPTDIVLSGNYINGYSDTTSEFTREVGSYATYDLVARYTVSSERQWLHGNIVTLAVTNIFNRNPPFVNDGSLSVPGIHYDLANADPIGRLISLELDKQW